MQAFYKITQKIKDILLEDENVHTVLFGVDNYRDLYKKIIYPVAHINPIASNFNSSQQNVVTLEIAVMDQRDLSKFNQIDTKWLSNDNQIDTLNTAHAVLNRLVARLRYLYNEGIEILSVTEAVPVMFKELDLVDGWLITITLAIPNTIDVCEVLEPLPLVCNPFVTFNGVIGKYDFATNTLMPILAPSGSSFLNDIANNVNKLWTIQSDSFKEYNLFQDPLAVSFVRDIPTDNFPLGPGLVAVHSQLLLSSHLNQIVAFDISDTIAVSTTIKVLTPGDEVQEMMLTNNSKLLVAIDNSGNTKLLQFDYPDMNLEVTVDLLPEIDSPVALSEHDGHVFIFNESNKGLYTIGLEEPYLITLVNTTSDIIKSASQIISCNTVSLLLPATSYSFSNIARGDAPTACADTFAQTLYSEDIALSTGTVLFTDNALTTIFDGLTMWYKSGTNAYRIDNDGSIMQVLSCSGTPIFNFALTAVSRDTSAEACNDSIYSLTLYSNTDVLQSGTTFYTDTSLTNPFDGQVGGVDKWYHVSGFNIAVLLDENGAIQNTFNCSGPQGFGYTTTRLDCECQVLGTGFLTNSTALTVGKIYYDVINNEKIIIDNFDGMFAGFGYSINDASGSNVCGDVICPGFCVPAQGYTYAVDIHNCDCTPSGAGLIENQQVLTIGNWYYDPVFNKKMRVTGFTGCGNGNDRGLTGPGSSSCAGVSCLPTSFGHNFSGPQDAALDACSAPIIQTLYSSFGPISSGDTMYQEPGLINVFPGGLSWYKSGAISYKINDFGGIIQITPCPVFQYNINSYDCSCNFVSSGNLYNLTPLTPGKWFYNSATGTKMQIDTFIGESTGFGQHLIDTNGFDTCAEVSCTNTAFAYFVHEYSCDCGFIGTNSIVNIEGLSLNKFHYDSITNTKLLIVAFDGMAATPDHFFIDSDGELSCEDIPCTCIRPTGLTQSLALGSFSTNVGSPCGVTSYNIVGAIDAADACIMWEAFHNCVCVGGINTFGYDQIEYFSLAPGSKLYKFHGGTNCTDFVSPGFYFFWDSTDSGTLLDTFCITPLVKIIEVGANGIITEVTDCILPCGSSGFEYVVDFYECDCTTFIGQSFISFDTPLTVGKWYFDPLSGFKFQVVGFTGCGSGDARHVDDSSQADDCADVICTPTEFITFTVNDLEAIKSQMGIVNLSDVNQWNTAFNTTWGEPTGAAFTDVNVSGNTITLYGGLDTLSIIPLYEITMTSFDTTHGLPALDILDLDTNNLTEFNPSVPLTSTILDYINLSDNNITNFNPSNALPNGMISLFLNSNNITVFNPLFALPPTLETLNLNNNLLTFFDPAVALPMNLIQLNLSFNQMTVFNPTITLPTIKYLILDNNLLTNLAPTQGFYNVRQILAGGMPTLTTVDFSTFAINTEGLNFSNCALTTSTVNGIFTKCVALGLHPEGGNTPGIFLGGGSNACPTGQGETDKNTLLANGCLVTFNTCI